MAAHTQKSDTEKTADAAVNPPALGNPPTDSVERTAASTGAIAGPKQIEDRTEAIENQIFTTSTATSERYTVLHTALDGHSEGDVVELDHLTEKQVKRLLRLCAVRVATADEIEAADRIAAAPETDDEV